MSSAVTVLAPNGRRQTVKCTPNTTIMQIIEEVCRKQGFKPEEYDIKHHNKVLDTTQTFRFSGLPNNAQLELSTATKARIDSEVILAVNLENGARLLGNFLPDETLSAVLTKLCPDEIQIGRNPVVIYMRNEIYGAKLAETTLRSLGLRGGRAMMRLIHKTPDELKIQANVSAPIPTKVVDVEEKPYHRTRKIEPELSSVMVKKNDDLLRLAREKRKLESSPSPVKTIESSETQQARSKSKIEAKEEAMEVDVAPSVRPPVKQPSPKSTREIRDEEFVFLGERNAMLFSLESAHSVPAEELPDDFFELTIDDAKKILGDIRRKRQEMENGTLMTAAMRNLEESKKQLRQLNKYKQAIIRVQFADRAVLQGIFKPTETIRDVTDFVRNYLEDKSCNFYLYTTPPKCVLSEQDRLMEIGCVPGALLHLGSDLSNNNVHLKPELKDKFTTNSLASLAASKMRRESTRSESPQNYDMEQDESMDTLTDINAPGPSSQPTSYERKIIKTSEKVPKWFKPV